MELRRKQWLTGGGVLFCGEKKATTSPVRRLGTFLWQMFRAAKPGKFQWRRKGRRFFFCGRREKKSPPCNRRLRAWVMGLVEDTRTKESGKCTELGLWARCFLAKLLHLLRAVVAVDHGGARDATPSARGRGFALSFKQRRAGIIIGHRRRGSGIVVHRREAR